MSGLEGFPGLAGFDLLDLAGLSGTHAGTSSWGGEAVSAGSLLAVSVLGAFGIALALSLAVTPQIRRLACRGGFMDQPSSRKVHTAPMPRLGGAAIFGSFLVAFGANLLFCARTGGPAPEDLHILGLVIGGAMAFGLGLADDLHRLSPRIKFLVQASTAVVAWFCGIGIHAVQLPLISSIQLGAFSLPVTIFWFVLVMNAINLIDGLDGLAAGVTVFSSIALLILCLINGQFLIAAGLAALAGAALGFLRYNFNPATIFMGDGGSYFIGFTLAGLSVVGSVKSEASVTILIPVLAMGLPLMETIWSTIRRFLLGQALFRPDRDHLHHRLLKMGYTHRRAVLVLYGVTGVTGLASLVMVHSNDRQAALVLAGIGIGFAVLIRKLGYIDYLTSEKVLGWLRDASGVIGMERGSRTFLGLQMMIAGSSSVDEAWIHITESARQLRMDLVRLELNGLSGPSLLYAENLARPGGRDLREEKFDSDRMMRIEFPVGGHPRAIGHLLLVKDVLLEPPDPVILRRVEHLRAVVSATLPKLYKPEPIGSPVPGPSATVSSAKAHAGIVSIARAVAVGVAAGAQPSGAEAAGAKPAEAELIDKRNRDRSPGGLRPMSARRGSR